MPTPAVNLDWRHGSNGTPTVKVDLSNLVASIQGSRTQDPLDATRFNNSGAKSYVIGGNDAEFTVEYFWDATIHAQLNALVGYTTAVDFQYGPNGSTGGYVKQTGTAFITSISMSRKPNDVMMIQANYKVNGTVTDTTY